MPKNTTVPFTKEVFMRSLHLKNIHISTASRWLKYIGYRHRERKKNYFCDKHEDPENIKARNQFINTYLNLEFRANRWVHIPESIAKKHEEENNLISAYHSFTKKGELFHEYHVDTHPCLQPYIKNQSMGGDLSIRLPKNKKTSHFYWPGWNHFPSVLLFIQDMA